MAPLFQRRSLLIRDDEPDYSVRARYSHGSHDAAVSFAPPPARIYSAPPQPSVAPPPASRPSPLKIRLEGLTGQARGLTMKLADAGRSRIATIAGRLAKTLSDTEPSLVAFAGPASGEAAMVSEERRWREYEAAQRVVPADSVSNAYDGAAHPSPVPDSARDTAAEILRLRAERILTEAERIDANPWTAEENSTPDGAEDSEPKSDIPIRIERGKYGLLMDQVGDQTPQNWDSTPEEPKMQEEQPYQWRYPDGRTYSSRQTRQRQQYHRHNARVALLRPTEILGDPDRGR